MPIFGLPDDEDGVEHVAENFSLSGEKKFAAKAEQGSVTQLLFFGSINKGVLVPCARRYQVEIAMPKLWEPGIPSTEDAKVVLNGALPSLPVIPVLIHHSVIN